MWVLGVLAGFFLLRSVIYSPAFSEWHSRTAQRMEWERQNPRKRSLLWKFAMYVVLPLVLVFGLFALAIYLT